MMNKLIKSLLIIGIFFFFTKPVLAADVTLHFFWSHGCPHCAKEKVYLNTLKEKYSQLTVKEYEITSDISNVQLMEKIGKELHVDVSGVPFTVIGEQQFIGYLNDETTGKKIEEAVRCAVENGCEDVVLDVSGIKDTDNPPQQVKNIPETLSVPIFGTLEIKHLSLPLLTLIFAFIDGFNPCAMWTLLFLISLLLGMKDRKRMWILGVAFIFSSALTYFLFLSAWLNFFLFLGVVVWVRMIIALVALGAGGYNIRDYFVNKKGGCTVMGDKKRQKIFEKIRDVTQKRQFLLALGGIIVLAIAVNMVELICSAGLPAIYTKILSLSNLPTWQYYSYLFFYTFIFMLDDLFIFFTAMITLQAVGIQSKYSRFSHLIGGMVMLLIGILLLFKPEWLMFG
jgi:glutaredoxin